MLTGYRSMSPIRGQLLCDPKNGPSGGLRNMSESTGALPAGSRGRLLSLAGLGLAVLGVAAYAIQLSLRRLMLPWYMPAAAVLGIALVIASMWRRRTVWRAVALVAVV